MASRFEWGSIGKELGSTVWGLSKADLLGGIIGRGVAGTTFGLARTDAFGGALTKGLATKALGLTKTDMFGAALGNRLVGADMGLTKADMFGGALSKGLVTKALGLTKTDMFGAALGNRLVGADMGIRGGVFAALLNSQEIAKTLQARHRLLNTLGNLGFLEAMEALGAALEEVDPDAELESLAGVVSAIDQPDIVVRLTHLLELILEKVRRLEAATRSTKVRAFEAMAIFSFIATIWTIVFSSSEPQWTTKLREDIASANKEQNTMLARLQERILLLEQLHELERTQFGNSEEEIARLTDMLRDRAVRGLWQHMSVVVARTPLRNAPRKNARVLTRVPCSSVVLVLQRSGKWAYVLILDDSGAYTREGWLLNRAIRRR